MVLFSLYGELSTSAILFNYNYVRWKTTMLIILLYAIFVDTEKCCPKGKCECQQFILLT